MDAGGMCDVIKLAAKRRCRCGSRRWRAGPGIGPDVQAGVRMVGASNRGGEGLPPLADRERTL